MEGITPAPPPNEEEIPFFQAPPVCEWLTCFCVVQFDLEIGQSKCNEDDIDLKLIVFH